MSEITTGWQYTEELEIDLKRAEKVVEAARVVLEEAVLIDRANRYDVPTAAIHLLAKRLIEYQRGRGS